MTALGWPMPKRFSVHALVLLLAACSDSVQVTDLGPVMKPDGHDQVAQDVREVKVRKVDVPPEVRARFKSVEMSVGLPGGGQPVRLEVPLGGRAESAGAGIVVAAKDYLPSFVIQGDTVTSKQGGSAENPSVWLEVQVKGRKVFSGWAFRDYPDLTPTLVPGYSVNLLAAKPVALE